MSNMQIIRAKYSVQPKFRGTTVIRLKNVFAAIILGAVSGMTAIAPTASAAEVNLYSYRQPFLMNPLLDAFTQQTGIKVNMVYLKKGMLERLKAPTAPPIWS